MRRSLALFVADRYLRSRRRDAGNASTILSVLGIAVGVIALTVVLAVMNGFQLGFIDTIVEVSSYHLQVRPEVGLQVRPQAGLQIQPDAGLQAGAGDGAAGSATRRDLAASLSGVRGVTAVVPFVERQALVDTAYQSPRACTLRAVPPSLLTLDPSEAPFLTPREGGFSLPDPHSIVIGSELAATLGARVGDPIYVTSFASAAGGRPVAQRDAFRVTGIFQTGYYDFDAGLAFIPLSAVDALYGNGDALSRSYGIKVANRFNEGSAVQAIQTLLQGTGYSVESWRSYNRSFFDALFVEKLMMMVLVGLIFVVVGFNVYHSLRRSVFERMEEIAVLKAIGVPPQRIQGVFILQGLFIGLAGGAIGLVIGLALAVNVNGVFDVVQRIVNGIIGMARLLVSPLISGSVSDFAIFSPAYFYLSSVPSHVYPTEAFLVAFFAVLSCAGAALGASRAVSRFRPAEVLRYE